MCRTFITIIVAVSFYFCFSVILIHMNFEMNEEIHILDFQLLKNEIIRSVVMKRFVTTVRKTTILTIDKSSVLLNHAK